MQQFATHMAFTTSYIKLSSNRAVHSESKSILQKRNGAQTKQICEHFYSHCS